MGKGGSAPQSADPQDVADAQIRVNGASYDQIAPYLYQNQVTPNGTLTYTVDPITGQRTQTNTLSPAAQAVFDAQNANTLLGGNAIGAALRGIDPSKPFDASGLPAMANAAGLRNGALQTGIDMSKLPGISMFNPRGIPAVQTALNTRGLTPMQSSIGTVGLPELLGQIDLRGVGGVQSGLNLSGVPGLRGSLATSTLPGLQTNVNGADAGARQQTIDSLYGQMTSRLDPQWKAQEAAQKQSLADRGITLESNPEAYRATMDEFMRGRNDAYQTAQNAAIQAGGAEQSRLFDLGLQQGQFGNAAQGQAFNQMLGAGQFANAANAQGLSNALNAGQFANAAQAQQYNQAANNAQFQNAARGQGFGEAAANANLANAVNQQGFNQLLGSGQFGNAGIAQIFSQLLQGNNANNAAQQQAYGQAYGNAGLNNAALGQQFGQDLAQGQLANQTNQQAFGQYQTGYQMPYNVLGMLQGQGNTLMPQYQSYNTMGQQAAPNMGQLYDNQYQGQLGVYNANIGQQNQQMATAGNLALMGLMLCSRAFKDTIETMPEGYGVSAIKALPVDRWRYHGDGAEHVGTYAEDWQRATGLGDGVTITVLDAVGVLTAAVKDLALEVDRLKAKLAEVK